MTLLELLVVMVILAMVSGLLVQGMGTALVTYERVQRSQQDAMRPELAYAWLRQTLQGAQAELDEMRQFKGNDQQLSGYTHQPLIGDSGQVHPFSWTLEQNDDDRLQLVYRQPGITWPVLTWPTASQGHFVYWTFNHGQPVSSWPFYADNKEPEADGRMPSTVLLEITEPDLPVQRWHVVLPGRSFPRGDYRDIIPTATP